jgi:hypothetical protein
LISRRDRIEKFLGQLKLAVADRMIIEADTRISALRHPVVSLLCNLQRRLSLTNQRKAPNPEIFQIDESASFADLCRPCSAKTFSQQLVG